MKSKQEVRELLKQVGLQYVCEEYCNKWKQTVYIAQSGSYQAGFREFKFIAEDLELKNLQLCVKLGVCRA